MRKMLALTLAALLCLGTIGCAQADFAIRFGDRESPKIAVTMDDCYQMECVQQALDLCAKYGVVMTFFPLGDTLNAEDAEIWQAVIDAGCEIGNHTNHHASFANISSSAIVTHIRIMQQKLDDVLGYHYEVRSLRPPFGKYRDEGGSNRRIMAAVQKAGYEHVVLWDVQDNDPEAAFKVTKNGSILLYHARKADIECLTALIPMLVDAGYELVTVRELLGFEENTISEEKYVYHSGNDR